jgi:KDO2-lipid IV(A) lauroyltransferase
MANNDNEGFQLAYLAPKFWPLWFGILLLGMASLLPYRLQLGLGTAMGRLAYRFAKRRRLIVQTNIRLCFPQLSPAEQKQLVRKNFESTGIGIFETALSWWGRDSRLLPLCHIEGREHLDKALQQGHGVILLTAHMTCLEIGAHLMAIQFPLQAIYKKSHNPLFEWFMYKARRRRSHEAIQTYETRKIVKALKHNRVTWYAMDQDFGRKQNVFVPFMGVLASTLITTSRLAKMSGALVVPYFPFRLSDGRGYRIVIEPALNGFPSGDDKQDAARINEIIGDAVRQAPEQYFWAHRRFKTRPEGEPDLYARSE